METMKMKKGCHSNFLSRKTNRSVKSKRINKTNEKRKIQIGVYFLLPF